MALARAQGVVVEQFTSLASPEVPNYKVAVSGLALYGFKELVESFTQCGGVSYLDLVVMGAFAGMAVNQFGYERTKNLVVNNSFALFNTVKAKIMPSAEPEEAPAPVVKKNA